MDLKTDDHDVVLGIDAGGTHTDAVICADGRLAGRAKVRTEQDDLPGCIGRVLDELRKDAGGAWFDRVRRVTLGTTLLVNAAVQNRLDPVGLALSAGPGLAPARFAMGGSVCVTPGGLDHRGVEVTPLDLALLGKAAALWREQGVTAFACVGKFSPRNPLHEKAMGEVLSAANPYAAVTLGHHISGELNFPRRIASAYYNSASLRLHNAFLDAVQNVLAERGCQAPVFLLRADGGAIPLAASRPLPVHSLLSGPAASVMGVMALSRETDEGCSLLLDMGGTTTDLAVLVDGSPVLDQDGMLLGGRRTLVRSLATVSLGVGGDSLLTPENGAVRVGPLREGPAMAFGGVRATLLDALNVLNEAGPDSTAGSVGQSRRGMEEIAAALGTEPKRAAELAWADAAAKIDAARAGLVAAVNERPIYTLRELREHRDAVPIRVAMVGGPAHCVRGRLEKALALPVSAVAESDVANAVGAALTRPSARLEVYADTGRGTLLAPSLDVREDLPRQASLSYVKDRALALLARRLEDEGAAGASLEVLSADLFATLSDSGRGSRDMRVVCQAVPGLTARLADAGKGE
ncbi:MAG: hydantoinase/oxoprolinase family protein [Desulfovibrionaceae bacterium]|nr:hydantoinase/oxoprolinase family protein [Desulfovibrionaceae bacterium]